MRRGNRDEEAVWNLYSADRLKLVQVTEGIKSLVLSEDPLPPKEIISGEEEQGEEGQLLTRVHRYRERDTRLVKRKKDLVLSETGTLRCAVCDFDFSTVYGKHGRGFIECHHTRPLSDLIPGEKTELSDLSLVCSNCHLNDSLEAPLVDGRATESGRPTSRLTHTSTGCRFLPPPPLPADRAFSTTSIGSVRSWS